MIYQPFLLSRRLMLSMAVPPQMLYLNLILVFSSEAQKKQELSRAGGGAGGGENLPCVVHLKC